MKHGTRVKVSIKNPGKYAFGTVETIEGKTGTVDASRKHSQDKVLVEFDEPITARPPAHPTESTCMWFDAGELTTN